MKIANKISLSFLITAVILSSISMVIAFGKTKRDMKKMVFDHLITIINSRVTLIETFLKSQKRATNQLAESIVLKDLLLAKKNDKNYQSRYRKAQRRLKNTARSDESVSDILLLDKKRTVIAATDENYIGKDENNNSCFLNARGEGVFTKDVCVSGTKKIPYLSFSTPVLDEEKTNFLGILIIRILMREINEITTNQMNLGKTGEVYLVNKNGFIISSSRFMEDTFLKLKVETEGVKKCLEDIEEFGEKEHEHKVFTYKNYQGSLVLGVHKHIEQLSWGLITEIGEKEALAFIYEQKPVLLKISFFVITGSWLCGIFVAGLIIRPVHALHKGTERIGEGDVDFKVGTKINDEVGQLSRAFDRMRINLKKSTISREKLYQEIAQRREIEEKLRLFSHAVESAVEGMAIANLSGEIIYVNEAFIRLFGYSKEEMIGEKINSFYFKEGIYKSQQVTKTIIRGNWQGELIAGRKDGTCFPIAIYASVVKDNKGRIIGQMASHVDITRRRETEEKMKEAVKIKSDFLSMVSHELRTPLTAIKEGISIVLDGSAGKINTDQEDFLATAKRNVDRLHRLINQVLDFSKLEARKSEFRMEENDLNQAITEIVKMQQPVAIDKGLYVRLELGNNMDKILFDKDKIIQVLINLTNNAFKHTNKGGITVSSKKDNDGKFIRVGIKDTGEGIEEKELGRLFEQFQQIGKKFRKPGSTGLGLAISKEIITGHKGKIWAESQHNVGSEFIFTLPIIKERRGKG
ncbi:PAS domain S-box protein [bacterium]|nr:PAS domain S-box protein [bacterium]